jgi:hypothetical protein
MIVYGYNNFLIKSYTPEELGIFREQGSPEIKLEVRQKYAHLFWIPFFPIGKIWVVKKGGLDTLYEMPVEIKNSILARYGTPGTPWYSFALFIIGLTIGLFYLIGDKLEQQGFKNDYYNAIGESKMFIKYPTTGDCYIFRKYDEPDTYSNSTDIILKVKSYNDNKTQFISLYPDLYKDVEGEDSYNYHKSFDLAEAYNYNPTFIDKKALENSLEDLYGKSKTPSKLEPLEGYYILQKIDRRKLEE